MGDSSGGLGFANLFRVQGARIHIRRPRLRLKFSPDALNQRHGLQPQTQPIVPNRRGGGTSGSRNRTIHSEPGRTTNPGVSGLKSVSGRTTGGISSKRPSEAVTSVSWDSAYPTRTSWHRRQGCFPSNVVSSARTQPEVGTRSTNIAVQATPCKATQCRPSETLSSTRKTPLRRRCI